MSGWTHERIETLKTLWLSGLSASEVARDLTGCTRNAVIGKIHRLGLARESLEISPPGKTRALSAPRAPRPVRPATTTRPQRPAEGPDIRIVITKPAPADFEEVARFAIDDTPPKGCCQWIIGERDAEGHGYCGADAQGPFCPDHHRLGHKPTRMVRPGAFAGEVRVPRKTVDPLAWMAFR